MAKPNRPRVLLDACALLCWIKDEPENGFMAPLMDFIDEGHAQIVESTIIFAEVYRPPKETEHWGPRMETVLETLRSRSVELCDVSRPVAEKAAAYRLKYKLHSPDAIHLATAVLNNCDWLVTKDRDFKVPEVDGTKIFVLRSIEDPRDLPWMIAEVQEELPTSTPLTVVPSQPRGTTPTG